MIDFKKKINIHILLYTFAMCLYTLMRIISSSYITEILPISFEKLNIIVNNFCILVLILLLFSKKRLNYKSFFTIILLTTIVGIITFRVHDKGLFLTYLFLISYPCKLKLDILAKKVFLTMVISIMIIVSLSLFGVVTNYTFLQHGTIRYSLGFVSANSLANCVTLSFLLYTYFKNNSIKKTQILFWLLITCFVYKVTNSRLAFYIAILNIVILIILRILKSKKTSKIFFLLCKFIFASLSILCILSTIYFSTNKNNIYNKINEIFTGRLSWMIQYYDTYGFNIVGQPILTVSKKEALEKGTSWSNVDNSYVYIGVKYGILFLIVLAFVYYTLGRKLEKNNDLYGAIYITLLCLIGMTENFFLMTGYNFSLVIIAKSINYKKEE